jgi:hypothetical protein
MSRRKQDPRDDVRRRLTDPATVEAFAGRVREGLRREYPDASEDEIEAWMARGRGTVGWAQLSTGVAATDSELAKLRRSLPGGRRDRR